MTGVRDIQYLGDDGEAMGEVGEYLGDEGDMCAGAAETQDQRSQITKIGT